MFAAGALVEQIPGRKYCASLNFFELRPKPPLPRTATLTRMGHQLPDGVRPALRMPRSAVVSSAGPLRLDEAATAMRDAVVDAAERLGARAIVIPTPAELTPGARGRELLARYVEGLPRVANRHLVWSPRGAWEPETKAAVCEELSLVGAFDPIHEPRMPGPIVYATLQALGYQTSFSPATLEEVLETIHTLPFDEAYVSIDSPRSFQQAVQLQQFADAYDE